MTGTEIVGWLCLLFVGVVVVGATIVSVLKVKGPEE